MSRQRNPFFLPPSLRVVNEQGDEEQPLTAQVTATAQTQGASSTPSLLTQPTTNEKTSNFPPASDSPLTAPLPQTFSPPFPVSTSTKQDPRRESIALFRQLQEEAVMEDEESLLDGKLPSFSSDDSICLIHIQPEAPATLDPLDPSSSPKSSTDREKDIVKDSGFAHQSSEPTTHTEEEIERRSNPFSKWMDPSFDNGPVVAEKDKKTLDEGRKVTKEDQEDVNIAELESKHEEKREEEWVNRMSLEERKINQVIRELDSPKEEAEHAQKLSTPPKPSTLSKSSFQDGSGDNDENCVFSGEITQEEKVLAAQIRRMVEHGTPFTKHRRLRSSRVHRTLPINTKGRGVLQAMRRSPLDTTLGDQREGKSQDAPVSPFAPDSSSSSPSSIVCTPPKKSTLGIRTPKRITPQIKSPRTASSHNLASGSATRTPKNSIRKDRHVVSTPSPLRRASHEGGRGLSRSTPSRRSSGERTRKMSSVRKRRSLERLDRILSPRAGSSRSGSPTSQGNVGEQDEFMESKSPSRRRSSLSSNISSSATIIPSSSSLSLDPLTANLPLWEEKKEERKEEERKEEVEEKEKEEKMEEERKAGVEENEEKMQEEKKIEKEKRIQEERRMQEEKKIEKEKKEKETEEEKKKEEEEKEKKREMEGDNERKERNQEANDDEMEEKEKECKRLAVEGKVEEIEGYEEKQAGQEKEDRMDQRAQGMVDDMSKRTQRNMTIQEDHEEETSRKVEKDKEDMEERVDEDMKIKKGSEKEEEEEGESMKEPRLNAQYEEEKMVKAEEKGKEIKTSTQDLSMQGAHEVRVNAEGEGRARPRRRLIPISENAPAARAYLARGQNTGRGGRRIPLIKGGGSGIPRLKRDRLMERLPPSMHCTAEEVFGMERPLGLLGRPGEKEVPGRATGTQVGGLTRTEEGERGRRRLLAPGFRTGIPFSSPRSRREGRENRVSPVSRTTARTMRALGMLKESRLERVNLGKRKREKGKGKEEEEEGGVREWERRCRLRREEEEKEEGKAETSWIQDEPEDHISNPSPRRRKRTKEALSGQEESRPRKLKRGRTWS